MWEGWGVLSGVLVGRTDVRARVCGCGEDGVTCGVEIVVGRAWARAETRTGERGGGSRRDRGLVGALSGRWGARWGRLGRQASLQPSAALPVDLR